MSDSEIKNLTDLISASAVYVKNTKRDRDVYNKYAKEIIYQSDIIKGIIKKQEGGKSLYYKLTTTNDRMTLAEYKCNRILNIFYPPKTPFAISADVDACNYMPYLSVKDIVVFSEVNKYCHIVAGLGLCNKCYGWFENPYDKKKALRCLKRIIGTRNMFRKYHKNITFIEDFVNEIRTTDLIALLDETCKMATAFGYALNHLLHDVLFIRAFDDKLPKAFEHLLFPWFGKDANYTHFLEFVSGLKNINVNVFDEKNNTPLYHAIKQNNYKNTELLLKAGSNADYREVAYSQYKQHGDLNIIKLMLRYGYNFDSGCSAIYHNYFIHNVIVNSDIKLLELLLKHNADLNVGICNKTPFLLACQSTNRLSLCKIILNHCIEHNVVMCINNGIKYCIKNEYYDVVVMVVNSGYAFSDGLILKYLISMQELNMELTIGLINRLDDIDCLVEHRTLLQYAAIAGHLYICQLLINKGANVLARDEDGSQALHHAARNNRCDICKFLLDNGAEINSKGMNDYTPIIFAVRVSTIDNNVIRLLASYGAETNIINLV